MVLQLDLQQSYLLSIERPGCISKQLVFNTTVPSCCIRAEGYSFPFQVNLEAPPHGGEPAL
jgi:hypothetical protein